MKVCRFLATIIIGTSLCLMGYQFAFAQAGYAGNASVEGRTYCFVLDVLIMRSPEAAPGMSMGLGPPVNLPKSVPC